MAKPDFAKLKVAELQKELSSRGLDTKGKKEDLIKRLQEAEQENPQEVNEGQGQEAVDSVEPSDHGQTQTNGTDVEAAHTETNANFFQAEESTVGEYGRSIQGEETAPANEGPETNASSSHSAPVEGGTSNEGEEIATANDGAVNEEDAQAGKRTHDEALASEENKDDEDSETMTKKARTESDPTSEAADTTGQSEAAAPLIETTAQNSDSTADAETKADPNSDVQIIVQQQDNTSSVQPDAETAAYTQAAEAAPSYSFQQSQPAYGDAYSGYPAATYPSYGAYPASTYGAASYDGGVQSVVIEVPNSKVGLVIGRGGCTIKELEQRSGGRIQITPDSAWQGKSEPRPIKIEGTPQQLEWLKQLIAEKVGVSVETLASNATFQGIGSSTASAPSHTSSSGPPPYTLAVPAPGGGVTINVPNESVGLVIGKQGANIRLLESQTGVKVQIAKDCPPETPNLRPITLIGSQYSIDCAREMIQAKIENKPLPQYESAGGGPPHSGYAPQPYPSQGYPPPQSYPPQSYAAPSYPPQPYGQPYAYPPQQYAAPPAPQYAAPAPPPQQQYPPPQAYPQYPPAAYPPQYNYGQQGYGYYPTPPAAPAAGYSAAPYYPPQ